ncbi:transposon-transfer assisting family protein [Enterococcus plantarum]|uniref:transposon-transfer assisting family protein n=1 Tax=Enterococcus plantarum TaxID=1077675 RepID=UPI001A8E9C44|nr:transposon-transfer assisting family protein [Enterococcus plantarum]MBO0468552.1 transposon-transfer assisting family protein [Enterococcus plantarum]
MMDFTVEEMNLMCIYNTESKEQLIQDIQNSLPYIYDHELKEITHRILDKLAPLSFSDYKEISFDFADDYYEEE